MDLNRDRGVIGKLRSRNREYYINFLEVSLQGDARNRKAATRLHGIEKGLFIQMEDI